MSGLKGNQKRGSNGKFEANPVTKPHTSLKNMPTGDIARINNTWYELTPTQNEPTTRPQTHTPRPDGLAGTTKWQLDDDGAIVECCPHVWITAQKLDDSDGYVVDMWNEDQDGNTNGPWGYGVFNNLTEATAEITEEETQHRANECDQCHQGTTK